MNIPQFVAVALSVTESEKNSVKIVQVPGLVVTTHEDKSVDVYVFRTSEVMPTYASGETATPFADFLHHVPLDANAQSAPSYSVLTSVAAPLDRGFLATMSSGFLASSEQLPSVLPRVLPSVPGAMLPLSRAELDAQGQSANPDVPAPGIPIDALRQQASGMPGYLPQGQPNFGPAQPLGMYANLPPGAYPGAQQSARVVEEPGAYDGPRVFGQGARGSHPSRGGQTFRNAELGMMRGEINASMAQRLGGAKNGINGQSPPRVFVKDGKGSREITTPDVLAQQPDQMRQTDVLDDILARTDAPAPEKLSTVAPTTLLDNGVSPHLPTNGALNGRGENHGAVGGRPL